MILIQNIIKEKNYFELNDYLPKVWNKVWSNNKSFNYADLRLFKTVDKIKNLIDAGVDFQNKLVLDIGCGNGTTLLHLKKYYNTKGVGIDISNKIINELKNINEKNLSFMYGDHRDLSIFQNDKFDIILSFGVIEHLKEYDLSLAEARRVLKPGGELIMIQPHLFSFGIIQEYYLRLTKKWQFGIQKDFSCFYYKSLLERIGYKNIVYFTKIPYTDMKLSRLSDFVMKKILPFWGHYLYLIAKK